MTRPSSSSTFRSSPGSKSNKESTFGRTTRAAFSELEHIEWSDKKFLRQLRNDGDVTTPRRPIRRSKPKPETGEKAELRMLQLENTELRRDNRRLRKSMKEKHHQAEDLESKAERLQLDVQHITQEMEEWEEDLVVTTEEVTDNEKNFEQLTQERDRLQAEMMRRIRERTGQNAENAGKVERTAMGNSRKWWHPPSALDDEDPLMLYFCK